jgi:Predicted membrane protein
VGIPVLCLLAGVVAGRLGSGFDAETLDLVINSCLCLVVFCAGMDVGAKRSALYGLRSRGIKVLLVPLGVVLGSLLGGALLGAVLHIPANESTAVAAGFGYYSLSSGLLASFGGAALGSLAFLSNIFRELLALLLIPLVARLHPYCAVAIGGATSMDTTLGMVARHTDEETTVISLLSGIVLSILVPILVPLLYQI